MHWFWWLLIAYLVIGALIGALFVYPSEKGTALYPAWEAVKATVAWGPWLIWHLFIK